VSENNEAIARSLKQQAEATLHANDQISIIRAAAIAGLAQTAALLAIHEAIEAVVDRLDTIIRAKGFDE
jgi:hypothetical protein